VRSWVEALPHSERLLIVNLGLADAVGLNEENPSRARQFLSTHGFLNALSEVSPNMQFKYVTSAAGFPSQTFQSNEVELLKEAIQFTKQCDLYYDPSAVCRPMWINSQANPSEISDFVDSIIQSMDSELFRARRSAFMYRDSALVRLRQIATEIITNSCEHAYPDNHPGPVYVYSRLRQHGDHSRERVDLKGVVTKLDVESRNDAPLVHMMHDVSGDRYVEFFVCDIGKGLVSDAETWLLTTPDQTANHELARIMKGTVKFPLRQLLSLIFRHPVSRHKRNNINDKIPRSNVTGLTHVNTVLSQHTDRSRIFVSSEWTAGEHPRPANYSGGSSEGGVFVVLDELNTRPKGTYFHFAIDISAPDIILKPYWLKPYDEEFNGLRAAFKPTNDLNLYKNEVFDLRMLLEGSEYTVSNTDEKILALWNTYQSRANELALVRMSRDFRKNLTDEIISKWAVANVSNATSNTLAFCDLSQAQAILLVTHLEKIKINLNPNNILITSSAEILIISEDLISCYLELNYKQNENFCTFSTRVLPPIANDVIPILKQIRRHDSKIFWDRVAYLCQRTTLLVKDVQWVHSNENNIGIRLPVYLDYSLAVQDRELAKIIRRSLRRALAAFEELNASSIDDLVKPDFDDARRWKRNNTSQSENIETLFVISSADSSTKCAALD
jgi:hypothetical protein